MTPTLTTFLSAFFPNDEEKIHLRSLPPRGVKGSAENLTIFREWFTRPVPQKKLKELNETRGMYFVVNSGGHSDEEISRLTACFVEADDIPIVEQHAKLDAAPIQPSIRIETRKSVHAHWLLAGEVSADRLDDWREAQRRLIAYFGGDPSIKNPSRVMRLPYFDHVSKDGSRKRIELTVFEPDRRYTLDELLAAFPPAPKENDPKPGPKSGAPTGNGYATWDALHAELGRRMMAHESANKNRAGKWDVRGICHDGQGDTGAFFDPSKNRGRCNVCDEATMLRGWGLPEKPEPPAQSKRQTRQTGDKQADANADGGADDSELPYLISKTGLVYKKWVSDRKGGGAYVKIPITNFVAEITSEIQRDDGTEQTMIYEVKARLARGGSWQTGSVNASEYDSLKWRHPILGAKAIVFPGLSEHARVAIPLLSNNISSRHVRAHTGWHVHNEEQVYLHAGGGLSASGLRDIDVELHDKLQQAILVEPPEGARLRDAIHAVFTDLIGAAEESITIPALGGVWAAPLTGVDYSEYFAGTTGYGKSEMAALMQSFWGANFNSRNFPSDWDWTEVALIALAHQAKDMLIVVDESSPKGSSIEQVKIRAKIDKVLRAQGNLSGRGRGNTDGTLRKAVRNPRGIILGTGEDTLRGESLQARVATLHFGPGSVDWAKMTTCQQQARDGLYVQIMSAYIQWLAVENRIGAHVSSAPVKREEYRARWFQQDRHKRIATMLGQLEMAWDVFFDFAKDCGALADQEVIKFKPAVKMALTALAESLANSRTIENPANRFIELIWSALGSGRAHLTTFTGGMPAKYSAMGWRADERIDSSGNTYVDYKPLGVRVGWINEAAGDVYLQKDAAYKMASDLAGSGGLTVSDNTLFRRMNDAGMLASINEAQSRNYIRKTIDGARQEVLHLKLPTLEPTPI